VICFGVDTRLMIDYFSIANWFKGNSCKKSWDIRYLFKIEFELVFKAADLYEAGFVALLIILSHL